METYKRIKAIREDCDKSQQEIADYLKIDRKTYCRYENGHHEIKAETLISLAKYYDLSLNYICGVTDVPESLTHRKRSNNQITEKQQKILEAYEKNPQLQEAIDKLLGVF